MALEGNVEMSRYDLSEFEWRVIAPLLPSKPRGGHGLMIAGAERDNLGVALRFAMARSAGAQRAIYDMLQSVPALDQGWRMGSDNGSDYRCL
jgi:transposase